MIDAVRAAEELGVDEVRTIVAGAFRGRAGVALDDDGQTVVWIKMKAFRSTPDECPAEFASAVMRQVSGRARAAARGLDSARGLSRWGAFCRRAREAVASVLPARR